MHPTLTPFARLRQHQRWIARNLLVAAESLDEHQIHRRFEIGPGSVFDLLSHLYRSDATWLAVLEGNPDPPPPDVPTSLAALRAAWDAEAAGWDAWALGLTPDDLSRGVAKLPSAAAGGGPLQVTPLSDVLLHVATHASYHAAQAVNMFRHLGVTPLPQVMMIALSRGERAASK